MARSAAVRHGLNELLPARIFRIGGAKGCEFLRVQEKDVGRCGLAFCGA